MNLPGAAAVQRRVDLMRQGVVLIVVAAVPQLVGAPLRPLLMVDGIHMRIQLVVVGPAAVLVVQGLHVAIQVPVVLFLVGSWLLMVEPTVLGIMRVQLAVMEVFVVVMGVARLAVPVPMVII